MKHKNQMQKKEVPEKLDCSSSSHASCFKLHASSPRGFSLIELLVVIAIIGILAGVIVPNLTTARAKGRDGKRISELKQIQLALTLYQDVNGAYPSALSALVPAYIDPLPVAPVASGEAGYTYNSSSPYTTYCLGVGLEVTTPPSDDSSCSASGTDYQVSP